MTLRLRFEKTLATVQELRSLSASAEDIGIYLASAGYHDISADANSARGKINGIWFDF